MRSRVRARHIIDAQEIDHAVMNSVVDNPDWGDERDYGEDHSGEYESALGVECVQADGTGRFDLALCRSVGENSE